MVPWMYSLSHRKCRPPPQGKALEMGSPAGESPRAHKYGVLQCILMALFSYCEMIVWNYGAVFIDCQRLTVHRDVILLIPLLKRGGDLRKWICVWGVIIKSLIFQQYHCIQCFNQFCIRYWFQKKPFSLFYLCFIAPSSWAPGWTADMLWSEASSQEPFSEYWHFV